MQPTGLQETPGGLLVAYATNLPAGKHQVAFLVAYATNLPAGQ
jgi:hypothetical protein